MKSLNIMIVDDSMIMIRNLSSMLNDIGHNVIITARNGYKAIEYIKSESIKPDIITMDITMPEMDGIEATKEIIKINKDALIIMITSQGQEQMVIRAIASGAKAYVVKPVDIEHLTETIEKVYTKYKK